MSKEKSPLSRKGPECGQGDASLTEETIVGDAHAAVRDCDLLTVIPPVWEKQLITAAAAQRAAAVF